MNTQKGFPLAVRMVGFAVMAMLAGTAFAEVGRVAYVSGEASLERANETPLTRDAIVESGDVITTGSDGRVQIRMMNGEFIALRPNTRFVIDEFSMPVMPEDPSSGRSFYSLLRGGFQAITGSFGARDLNSYRVHTPVATLGIRGTNFAALLGPNGLHVGVKEGAISMSNSAGILNIGAGQVGFAGETFAPPELAGGDQMMTDLFEGPVPETTVATSEPVPETGGSAAGDAGARAAASGEPDDRVGIGLLVLGGIGLIAAAIDGGGGSSTTTNP